MDHEGLLMSPDFHCLSWTWFFSDVYTGNMQVSSFEMEIVFHGNLSVFSIRVLWAVEVKHLILDNWIFTVTFSNQLSNFSEHNPITQIGFEFKFKFKFELVQI